MLHTVTCTENMAHTHVHTQSKPGQCTLQSWVSKSHPYTMYTRMHTHNSHLHIPVTQALCTHPHMYTPCVHTQSHSHTHTARAWTPASSTSLILPSPTESPPALQFAKSLTFPSAFIPSLHTQLAALEGSQGGRLPELDEEQSWTEQRNEGQNSVLGTGSSTDSPCGDRPPTMSQAPCLRGHPSSN